MKLIQCEREIESESERNGNAKFSIFLETPDRQIYIHFVYFIKEKHQNYMNFIWKVKFMLLNME